MLSEQARFFVAPTRESFLWDLELSRGAFSFLWDLELSRGAFDVAFAKSVEPSVADSLLNVHSVASSLLGAAGAD
jgi:hypothetical protein